MNCGIVNRGACKVSIYFLVWMFVMNLSGSSTPGIAGSRLWPKILDTIGSLQQQTAGEPYTPYQIRPHHSWLKRRATNLKRTKPVSNPHHNLFLITEDVGWHDFTTCQHNMPPSLTRDEPEHPVTPIGGF
jgi:hypothetical protein